MIALGPPSCYPLPLLGIPPRMHPNGAGPHWHRCLGVSGLQAEHIANSTKVAACQTGKQSIRHYVCPCTSVGVADGVLCYWTQVPSTALRAPAAPVDAAMRCRILLSAFAVCLVLASFAPAAAVPNGPSITPTVTATAIAGANVDSGAGAIIEICTRNYTNWSPMDNRTPSGNVYVVGVSHTLDAATGHI